MIILCDSSSLYLDRNIPPFYASLKDDRDLWFLFLSEMSAAHKSAEAMRDPKMVDAGKNNVLVASALLEMQYPLKTVEGIPIILYDRINCILFAQETIFGEELSKD